VACRPGPATRHAQAGRQCTTQDHPGSVQTTRCRALAARGHVLPAPARGRLPRASSARASHARHHRAGRARRHPTTRSGRGLTRTHQDPARVRPAPRRGPRRPGIRSNPGTRDRTSPGRPGPTPGPHRAGRDRSKAGPRPGGRRERDAPGSKRDTSPLRSGPVRRVPCRRARPRAVQSRAVRASTPPGRPGPASQVLAGQVRGRDLGHSRMPTVTSSRGRQDSQDTGGENPSRDQAGTGRVSSPPDSRDPASSASSARTKGQGRPAKVSLARVRSARARRPAPGRTARRLVRCRTATPTRTVPDSLAARRCPDSSAITRGTPDPGRPPARSRDLTGRLAGDRTART
jgi:hypothetical protein